MRILVFDMCSGRDGWTAAFRERDHDCISIDKEAALMPLIEGDLRNIKGQARLMLSAYVEPGWMPDLILFSPPCEGFAITSVTHMWWNFSCRTCLAYCDRDDEGQMPAACPACKTPNSLGLADPPRPKHQTAIDGLEVLDAGLAVIAELQPSYFFIENPRAMMRKMPQMRAFRHVEITQCSYGRRACKATDLWGRFPDTWTPRPFCNADASNGVVDDLLQTYTVEPVGKGKSKTFRLHAADGRVIPVPRDGRPVLHGRPQALRVLKDGEPCHEWSARGFKTGTQGIEGSSARAVIPYDLSLDVCRATEKALYRRMTAPPVLPLPPLPVRPRRRLTLPIAA